MIHFKCAVFILLFLFVCHLHLLSSSWSLSSSSYSVLSPLLFLLPSDVFGSIQAVDCGTLCLRVVFVCRADSIGRRVL